MTSQVKGTINHNFPVEVVLREGGLEKPIKRSEGSHGNLEIDTWFHGTQEVVIREYTPKPAGGTTEEVAG